MSDVSFARTSSACVDCGSELGPAQLACPGCGRLVHAEKLRELAASAEAAERANDPTRASTLWREALELLPPGTRQRERIDAKLVELGRAIDAPAPREKGSKGIVAGAIGVVVFLASKGKLLLLGLTKWSTLLTMFLSFGAYWTAFGWKFAAGLVASIYVHEMGHVAALRRFGIPASAPMFVPGLGAFVRLKQSPSDVHQDARVGLAGPVWGTAAAIAFWIAGTYGEWPAALAIAHIGAWINLFNLVPVWQLDGARGMRALSRGERWIVALVIGAAWFANGDGILLVLGIAAVWRAFAKDAPAAGDKRALVEYAALVVVLALLAREHA